MGILGIVALAATVGGCAGTDTHLRMLENTNALQIEPVRSNKMRARSNAAPAAPSDRPKTLEAHLADN
jgi:hypothetical protein